MPKAAPAPLPAEDAGDDIAPDVLNLALGRLGLSGLAVEEPADEAPEVPTRDEGESDEDYSQRLGDAGLDPAEHLDAAPAEGDDTTETEPETETDLADEDETETDEAADPEAPELTDEEKRAAAQKAKDEADLRKLPESARKTAQAVINRIAGRITAKAKAKETELSGRVATLETELAEAREAAEGKPARATVVGTVHPLLLDPSEAAIEKYQADVEAFEDWAADHEDGYEPSEAELAQGYKPLTKAEVRTRLRTLQRERDKIVAQARTALTARTTAETEARKIIPAFFDAQSPDYRAARSLLREQPELKRFPDHMLRAAEIVLGRKALAALRTAAAKPKPRLLPGALSRAPRAPGGGSAPKGGALPPRKAAASDAAKAARDFAQAPTRENLARIAADLMEDDES